MFAIGVQLSFNARTKTGSSLVIKCRQRAVRGRCSFQVSAGELGATAVHDVLPLTETPSPLQFSH